MQRNEDLERARGNGVVREAAGEKDRGGHGEVPAEPERTAYEAVLLLDSLQVWFHWAAALTERRRDDLDRGAGRDGERRWRDVLHTGFSWERSRRLPVSTVWAAIETAGARNGPGK